MNGEEEDDEEDREYIPPEEDEVEEDDDDDLMGTDSFLNDFERAESESDTIEGKSESDTIAKRTRSKFQIDEEPKDTLEFPDVTEDLYGTNHDNDDDWIQFLNSLYQDNPSKLFDEDETNDPEYNVFEDIDDTLDMNEDKLEKSHETDLYLRNKSEEVLDLSHKMSSISNVSSEWSQFFTENDLKLLYQQMAQHVQLLSQSYLLTMQSQTLNNVAKNASFLLQEINKFGSNKEVSIFKPLNLQPALKLLQDYPSKPTAKITSSTTWRMAPVPLEIRPVFALHPHIFIYHHLLPKCGYFDIRNHKVNKKTQFTKAEDHLIAMGLEQLKSEKNCYKMIKNLLVPTKSEAQIRTHVKNKRRRSQPLDETNPISYYFKHNKLFSSPKKIEPFKTSFDDLSSLPDWLVKTLKADEDDVNHSISFNRYQVLPPKNFLPPRLSSTSVASPCKPVANSIIKKYKYLTKYPFIKPKPEPSSPVKVQDVEMKEVSNVKMSQETTESTEPHKDSSPHTQTSPTQSCPSHQELAFTSDDHGSPNEDEDNESDLAALMVASTTITSSKARNKSHDSQNSQNNKKEGKKSLLMKQKESTNLLLSEDWLANDLNKEQKEELMVQCFLNKVREVLNTDKDFIEFLEYFLEFGESRSLKSSIQELHQKMQQFLRHMNAQKVMEEFVLLLSSTEAKECDKMFEYLHWNRYLSFMRKLEVYSMVEPNCISRLQKALLQLKQNEGPIDKQKLKSAVSKVINGHPYLVNEFSTLFLSEKPKEHLFTKDEDFDNVTINQIESSEEPDDFENVNLALTPQELKYGTNECPCIHCHDHQQLVSSTSSSSTTSTSSSNCKESHISKHCIACSMRFIGGKVYLQGPKKMQTAEVQYHNKKTLSSSKVITDLSKKLENVESSRQENEEEDKSWIKADDKLLLELCKAKVTGDEISSLSSEMFEEIASRLSRKVSQVKERFQKLMEMFTSDSRITNDSDDE